MIILKNDDVNYMDFGWGWWFYFGLRVAAGDEEFKNDFMKELELNFLRGDDVIGTNGKAKKRVAVRRVRKQVP